MRYELKPFRGEYVERAAGLFLENYGQAGREEPLLPSRAVDGPEWISRNLRDLQGNTGTTIWCGGDMLGYMVTGVYFTFKEQKTAWIPEYAHAAIVEDKEELYRLMYMTLGRIWAKERAHLHLICHLAGDGVLTKVLWELGFGAILAEQVRDLSPVKGTGAQVMADARDISELVNIEKEHRLYYRESPIFILKDGSQQSIRASLKEHSDHGDQIFVYTENAEPFAYVIVGRADNSVEGFLFCDTNTAQVKSAYAKPEARGRGVGASLLGTAVEWARVNGYDRLFVEHETANYYGGRFWRKHFRPVVYVSMRYIDTGI